MESGKSVKIENAVVTLESPYKLSYALGDRKMQLDVAIHSINQGLANALVYFPMKARWNAPHEREPVSGDLTDTISDAVEAALTQMGYHVKFCLPMGL